MDLVPLVSNADSKIIFLMSNVNNNRSDCVLPRSIYLVPLDARVFDSVEYVQAEGAQPVAPGVYELTGIPAGKYIVRRREPRARPPAQSAEM